jgi:transposase
MARYRPYDYSQMMMVPVTLSEQLVPGSLEHTIHYLVEERLDLRGFDDRYRNDATGRRAYDPRMLMKIVLYGYSLGLKGSRRLEAACKENVIFMALACAERPDHSTIADFVSGMEAGLLADLFSQILLVCSEEGLLSGTHFAIDGVKLPSNASKEWSGTRADLVKKKDKLRKLVRSAMKEHRRIDRKKGDGRDAERERIEKLRRKADRIEEFLAQEPERIGKQGKEIQSNVTDNESAKMKTSHGIVQGYNANAMVDEKRQIVVHAEAFGDGNDGTNAGPMLEGARQNLAAAGLPGVLTGAAVSADTSYYTNANLEACEAANVDAYIPDPKFRSRDPRFAEAKRHRRPTDRHKLDYQSKRTTFGPRDFVIDTRSGGLICPAGQRLYRSGSNILTKEGYRAKQFKAASSTCAACALRTRCLKDPDQKSGRQVRIFLGKETTSRTDAMKTKIDTPLGRKTYSKRLGIVEPVFANITVHKNLNRFTLRGKAKVNVQWKLYCMVHNMEKLGKYAFRDS